MNITNEDLIKLNHEYNAFIGVDTHDEIEFDEEYSLYSCYAFMFGTSMDEDDEPVCWVSFNDAIPTSTILNIANFILPILDDMVDEPIFINPCHSAIYDKQGAFKELLYENNYRKTITGLPKKERT
jgi:hypothetical protein